MGFASIQKFVLHYWHRNEIFNWLPEYEDALLHHLCAIGTRFNDPVDPHVCTTTTSHHDYQYWRLHHRTVSSRPVQIDLITYISPDPNSTILDLTGPDSEAEWSERDTLLSYPKFVNTLRHTTNTSRTIKKQTLCFFCANSILHTDVKALLETSLATL